MSPVEALRTRGVAIPCPDAVVLRDIDPSRFEAGVEIYPGCTIEGASCQFGAGTRLGKAGGGYFRNVHTGRNVDLFGGTYEDCVFLDDVSIRGSAEVRGGTLLEEGCEGAHHVGYKMTIMLPCVVAGSLINFCDALVAGGTGRSDHSEIGSSLALYNFTPWGDKFASQFGDVPAGVFLRSPRIFVGGQSQIVSPVHIGYGTVIPAGVAVRRSVRDGRIYGERMDAVDRDFDPLAYGGLTPKFVLTAEYIGNLRALDLWYRDVRVAAAADTFHVSLYEAARDQIAAGIRERIHRLGRIVERIPASRDRHQSLLACAADPGQKKQHERRIAEHERIAAAWPRWKAQLEQDFDSPAVRDTLHRLGAALAGDQPWLERLRSLPAALVSSGTETLQAVVDAYRLHD